MWSLDEGQWEVLAMLRLSELHPAFALQLMKKGKGRPPLG
jgi:hypothetical protein